MDTRRLINSLTKKSDAFIKKQSPYVVIAATLAIGYGLQEAYRVYKDNQNDLRQLTIDTLFNTARYIPGLGYYIDQKRMEIIDELEQALKDSNNLNEEYTNLEKFPVFPEEPLTEEQIQARFNSIKIPDLDLSGTRYGEPCAEEKRKIAEAWASGAWIDDKHPNWKPINLMRKEIISGCQALFHGKPGDPGIITHSITTSIFEIIGSYALNARENGNQSPEILIPESAHIAFDNAAALAHVRLVKIPVGEDGKVIVKEVEFYINSNTVLIVASAPSFPYRIIDPIEELGKLADKHNLPIHIDLNIGGFTLAHADRERFPNIPICDFRINAVKSLSAEFPKCYGGPESTSVLLMKEECEVRPYLGKAAWMSEMSFSEGINGSKANGEIAALWFQIYKRGKKYYDEKINHMIALTKQLKDELSKQPDVLLCYEPELTVITIKFKPGINLLTVKNQMKLRKNELQVIQSNGKAHALHFCLSSIYLREEKINATNNDIAQSFVHDFMLALSESIDHSKNHPAEKVKDLYQAYGLAGWNWLPSNIKKEVRKTFCEHGNTISTLKK